MLPDIIDTRVQVLFVSAAPRRSWVESGHYHSESEDPFFGLLYDSELTPEKISPSAGVTLLNHGIGLTTLAKTKAVDDPDDLKPMDFATGRLIRLAFEFSLELICFEGTATYRYFFDRQGEYGLRKETIGSAAVFIVPDSSTFKDAFEYRDVLHYYNLLDKRLSDSDGKRNRG